jgi:uncharacterized protein YjbJ (UPF0337 family)
MVAPQAGHVWMRGSSEVVSCSTGWEAFEESRQDAPRACQHNFPARAEDARIFLVPRVKKQSVDNPTHPLRPPARYTGYIVMTSTNLIGHWNEIKGKLKQKFAQLTDDDLKLAEGREDELLGRLQKRLGKSKEDVRAEIERL